MNKRVISVLSFGHMVNDFLNNILTAILPLLAVHFHLSYTEVGVLTMTANVSSSLIQPIFGFLSDKRGSAWMFAASALALGIGLVWIPYAPSFIWLLPAVVLSGIGSAAFHPDASRAVYFAAGNRRGLSQSVFQVGGNTGLALSALALWFLNGVGLRGSIWFMIPAAISTALMFTIVRWFGENLRTHQISKSKQGKKVANTSKSLVGLGLLVAVVTVRSWIVSGITTFVPLYLIHNHGISERNIWIYSFVFLFFGAIGTLAGGPMADRFGHRHVIRLSMFISSPLAILLPYLSQSIFLVDLALLGFFLLSTFAVTVVYGQEMLPGNIAMVSGLLIGFAGGIGGIGTMLMGYIADLNGLQLTLAIIMWTMPCAAICTLILPMDAHRREMIDSSSLAK